MVSFKYLPALVLSCLNLQSAALAIGGKPLQWIKPYNRELLQDIVTWDEHSLFVRDERILFYSGEFHPFRLPVPSLWLDVFQKIRALGYNGVSFYVDWALLEGKPGNFTAEGVFALEPFFDAAQQAGIYLLARPGPYINAEVSGGGFPGWLQRIKGSLRTADEDYLHATDLYVQSIGSIIAKAQITNGGPVILFQPENEYTNTVPGIKFPDPVYFAYVERQYRDAGIVVPFISNDARPRGYFAPNGTNEVTVDIYGHDGYPLGFDCANPYTWPDGALPTNWHTLHEEQSPNTPYSIIEFQGGSFDPWGGLGFAQCSVLLNHEFERVFYKNDFSFGVTIFNIYMTYGGTNWGNLGHPGGYTSYDYGAAITEDRLVTREKYSEAKLEANFLQASSSYLTAVPGNASNGSYTDTTALAVTPLFGNKTNFYVVRHAAYNSLESTDYKLVVPTSAGTLTIPQLEGVLTLNGRDSKIHVTDYPVGDINLLYSSAEIFTWKAYGSRTVLVVYGGPNEHHEMAFPGEVKASVVEGSSVTVGTLNGATVLNWQTTSDRKVVRLENNIFVHILDRNSAYNYWVLDLAVDGVNRKASSGSGTSSAIVKAGYLLRTAEVKGNTLALTGDLNATTAIEVIGGAPDKVSELTFNGEALDFEQDANGVVTATATYTAPAFDLPDLSSVTWYYLDSLPEIQSSYSDTAWTDANLPTSNNTVRNLTTPTSLYSSDYGYHTGTLLYRGHFTATGGENTLYLQTQGGSAFGMSAWLNGTFVGSYAGIDAAPNATTTFTLPNLAQGRQYVITVVIDNMGLDEDFVVGSDTMKRPRGILDYDLAGHEKLDVTWRLTGNLGGEDYRDFMRGPLNEGGMYAERQGYHLPAPPVDDWATSTGPAGGISSAGIGFFVTSFELDMPKGYDIPLSFIFTNSSSDDAASNDSSAPSVGTDALAYRVQLYVNGYQFGKYVHNIGPQDSFPVPEGIFNYHGTNWVAMSLWSLEAEGAKVEDVRLVAGPAIQTGYGEVALSPMSKWEEREGAY